MYFFKALLTRRRSLGYFHYLQIVFLASSLFSKNAVGTEWLLVILHLQQLGEEYKVNFSRWIFFCISVFPFFNWGMIAF